METIKIFADISISAYIFPLKMWYGVVMTELPINVILHNHNLHAENEGVYQYITFNAELLHVI